jgi:hypothetical protein
MHSSRALFNRPLVFDFLSQRRIVTGCIEIKVSVVSEIAWHPKDRRVEPISLRSVCAKLRWKIISDSSIANETALSAF